MTKILKRPLSILLAVLMIASIFAAVPLTAHADSTFDVTTQTIVNLKNYITVTNNKNGTITVHMPQLSASTVELNHVAVGNGNTEYTLHYGYELVSSSGVQTGGNIRERSWNDHTAFSSQEKTIDITNGKPYTALLIVGHPSDGTCIAPGKEPYWGIYKYPNPKKITYNLNGGNIGGSTANKTEYLFSGDTLATTFSTPQRTNYFFKGWYTAASGGTKVTASNATAATTYYAQWTPLYTVTWNNWDNSELEVDTDVEAGTLPTYDGETPTKAEDENYTYTFSGWNDGSTTYGLSDTLPNVTANVTYTATFEATPKTPELFWKHSVTLGGDIGVNFYLNPAVLDTYTGTKTVTFSWDGNETTVDVPATATADGYKVTCNVVAAQMAHKIHAVVYVGDTALDQTDDYSVQDYAETVYANPSAYDSEKPEQLQALAKAMLNYGAMAQTVFAGSLTEAVDLPTGVVGVTDFSGVTAENIAAAIKDSASDLNTAAAAFDAEFYTSSLIYLSRNTLRLYFTPASKTVGALNGLEDFSGNLSEYYYYVDKANIAAAELDNQQIFSVNGTEFTFSALDYAKAVVNSNNMSDTQKDLAKSLYLYNQAANAYFDPTV